jgi:hypothetical protein
MIEANTYEVVVEAERESVHQVRLSFEYYKKLCGGSFTHEWVIAQAFQFLLERTTNNEIFEDFDLSAINRYFPEFEDELIRRLNRR